MLYQNKHRKLYEDCTDKKLLLKRISFLIDTQLLSINSKNQIIDSMKEVSYILDKLRSLI